MTENEIKNIVGKISKQMENYAKNVGTDSANYRELMNLAKIAGFEFAKKGDYQIVSAGKDSTEKFRNMSPEKQTEIKNKLESMQTWGQQKEYYQQRLKDELQGKTRGEQKEIIRAEIQKDDYMENELSNFIQEVYQFLAAHDSDGIYLDTLPSEPYRHYAVNEVDGIVTSEIDNMSFDDIRKYVDRVRDEMSRGGTFGGMSQSITSGLWKIKPENP